MKSKKKNRESLSTIIKSVEKKPKNKQKNKDLKMKRKKKFKDSENNKKKLLIDKLILMLLELKELWKKLIERTGEEKEWKQKNKYIIF